MSAAGAPAAGHADALRDALGAAAVVEHDPVHVDGTALHASFRPVGAEALAEGLALLSARGAALVVRGGGSRLHVGCPPARADLLLDTRALDGIDVFEPDEGVIHAAAGTRLATLHAAVRAEGWELPLDAAGPDATLGGVIAAAASGPRAQGLGAPRDAVLGLEVALATGERTRCGSRVVKNVTGFDLGKLYTGSFGTLGVIEGAWLRLRPRPGACLRIARAGVDLGPGALEPARLASVRAAVWLDARTARDRLDVEAAALLVLELAGAPEAVERDAALARAVGSDAAVPDDALERVRDRASAPPREGRVRAVLTVRPSRVAALAEAMAALAGDALQLSALPALGRVEVELPWEGLETAARVRAVAREAGGHAVFEGLAPGDKPGVDVFGIPPASLVLMRELKRRFDPAGLLNPGRCGEGV